MKARPIILLVEPDADNESLARKVIRHSEVDCEVRIARDGVEACAALFHTKEKLPNVILLELDLPKLDGFEVLTRIREHEETKRLTVIVFTHSKTIALEDKCYDLHANSFVQKDLDLDFYETRLKLLLYYWIAVNRNSNT